MKRITFDKIDREFISQLIKKYGGVEPFVSAIRKEFAEKKKEVGIVGLNTLSILNAIENAHNKAANSTLNFKNACELKDKECVS